MQVFLLLLFLFLNNKLNTEILNISKLKLSHFDITLQNVTNLTWPSKRSHVDMTLKIPLFFVTLKLTSHFSWPSNWPHFDMTLKTIPCWHDPHNDPILSSLSKWPIFVMTLKMTSFSRDPQSDPHFVLTLKMTPFCPWFDWVRLVLSDNLGLTLWNPVPSGSKVRTMACLSVLSIG